MESWCSAAAAHRAAGKTQQEPAGLPGARPAWTSALRLRCRWRGAAEPQTRNATQGDCPDLSDRRRAEQNDHGYNDGDRCALAVRAERARHSPNGLRDDRHRDELEAMQQAGPDRSLQGVRAIGKEDEQYGGWKREGSPCSEAAEIAAPHQPNGKSDLAAGRTRQKLAQRDQIGEGGLVDPATPDHELLSK